MSTESAVANSLASAGKRLESMSLHCEMLAGQIKGERRQLEEIKAALAVPVPGHEEPGHAPGDASLAMLEG